MDSLTQIVLGAAVGEAVAGKKIGGKAALWGAVGGTLPDLDVLLRALYDPLDAALVHRGFSHSLLFALLAGPLLGWCFHKITKQRHTLKMWILLWFLAIVTHPMLDIFTNYGTQFFWPFSPRITFNTVFVIDPLYTVPFMILLIGALFMKRESKRRRIWNWTGIVYSSTYLLWGVVVKLCILGNTDDYFAKAGIEPKRVMVTPMPLTSFYWDIVAEGDTCYYIANKSLFSDFDAEQIEIFPKNHDALKKIRWQTNNKAEEIEYITNGYYSISENHDSITVYDLRFGTATRLSNKKVNTPIFAYGILTKNGAHTGYFPARSPAFKYIDFGRYLDFVFGGK